MSGKKNDDSKEERTTSDSAKKSYDSSGSDNESDEDTFSLTTLEIREPAPPVYIGTGLVYDEIMTMHKCDWDPDFPENPLRLTEPYKRCCELGLIERCERIESKRATDEEILTKHTKEHLELTAKSVSMSYEERMELCQNYDAWYCNDYTYDASMIAAGTTIQLMNDILESNLTNGFAMVRPPGHHAMESEFNGYCTFNNVALAAQDAINKGVERILIVDWDVHHGQGIQRLFYNDPRVLYFSIHRYEYGKFWPELRESDYDYIGEGPGKGFNINVPLNKIEMTDSDYMTIVQQILLPLAYEYNPQLVLVSSGYDAAVGCIEGEMLITPPMYAHMIHHLLALAKGRVCVALEGGYCIKSLSEGCALTLRSLLQDPCPLIPATVEPSDSIVTTILNLVKVLSPYWKCFKHYKKLESFEKCVFKEVNNSPPLEGVVFQTSENRPEKYKLTGFYPVQTDEVKRKFQCMIENIIDQTKLGVAATRCCYTFDAQMKCHKNTFSLSHPERPARIISIHKKLTQWGLLDRSLIVPSRIAKRSELLWIHNEQYVDKLKVTELMDDESLRDFPHEAGYPSIYCHQKSLYCALLAAGSLLNVVEAVLTNQAQSGVANIRPPGHHAEYNKAMGFCFFNNVAVAAKFAQKKFGVKRILIVDWDVHHGNATQHQFYRDPSVLYISLHRFDNGHFFPGHQDASATFVGSGPGEGYNVNIPWCGNKMGDAEYLMAFTQIIMPIAYQFAPELVLVSAGFDSAVGDPLGGYAVTPAGYAHMTHMLMGLANGRVILTLEGGYNLKTISECMAACTSVLLGDQCPALKKLVPCDSAAITVNEVLLIQKNYWSCLKFKEKIPKVEADLRLPTFSLAPKPKQYDPRKTISCGNIKSNQTKTTSDISDITTTDITDITSTSGLTASKTDSALTCSSDARITYSSLSLPSAKEKLKDVNQSHNDGPESAPEQEIISAMGNLSLDTASSASQPKRWVDPDDPYDRVSDPVKKIFSCQKPIEPYRSVVYANDPGSPPLSRFATGHDEYVAIDEPVAVDSSQYKDREETIEFPAPPFRRVTRSSTSEAATVAGSSRDANQVTGGGDESLGAWGGSSRPANVLDLVRTQAPRKDQRHRLESFITTWSSDVDFSK
ncbi:histone deacetylase 6-like isoform X3 [Biomphalaria glabrata]|uniref:Histone deacetylase 6-like isoform X3 n=1 Tax=Biomphalaria glabrata TaxID=6526 RepID=A0A9W3A3Q6_BIOGL|nr:histone deacetylase 6-like isoform X3 [Biomphalaria glabrata]